MRILLLLILVMSFGTLGCGREEPNSNHTDVIVRTGEPSTDLVRMLSGFHPAGPYYTFTNAYGLIVFAQNMSSTTAIFMGGRKFISSGQTSSWSIPNGSYRFWAIGYGGPSMASQPYCGIANSDNPITLDGATVSLGITMAQITCDSGALGAADVSAFSVAVCQPSTSTDTASSITQDCSTLASPGVAGTGWYAQLSIDEADEFSGGGMSGMGATGIRGTCTSINNTTGIATMPLPVVGNTSDGGSHRVIQEINLYNTAGCPAANWQGSYRFAKGISFADGSTANSNTYIISNAGVVLQQLIAAKWVESGGSARLFLKRP